MIIDYHTDFINCINGWYTIDPFVRMLVNSISSMEKLLQDDEVVFGVESRLTSTSSLTLTPPARTLTSILADALGHTVRR